MRYIILVAPNVSEQMGGEAMKALQIFREFKKSHDNVVQITHERTRDELSRRLKLQGVYYVKDTWLAKLLWRSRVFLWFLTPWFSWKAVKLAESIASTVAPSDAVTIVHQSEPNSPVAPRFLSKKYFNAFGPINGNIYYPSIFRQNESASAKLRRILHRPA